MTVHPTLYARKVGEGYVVDLVGWSSRVSDQFFEVSWQPGRRPTRRQLNDLGGAYHLAHQVADLHDLPVIDLTGDSE